MVVKFMRSVLVTTVKVRGHLCLVSGPGESLDVLCDVPSLEVTGEVTGEVLVLLNFLWVFYDVLVL